MHPSMILDALARLIDREQRGDRGGDILERAVGKKKGSGGNAGTISISNAAATVGPLGKAVVSGPQRTVPIQVQDLLPDVYTVQFTPLGLPPTAAGIAPAMISTVADVVFSVDGRTQFRRINVNQGARICGQADAVSVTVKDNSNPADPGRIPAAFEYQVSIAVSRGVRPDQFQPPTLYPTNADGFVVQPPDLLLAPAASKILVIPQGVGVLAVNVTALDQTFAAIPEGKATVDYMANGVILRSFDARVAPWIPIVPGANQLRLTNNAANNVQFSALFGIDG